MLGTLLASEKHSVGTDLSSGSLQSIYYIGKVGFRFKNFWLQNSNGIFMIPFWVRPNFFSSETRPQLTGDRGETALKPPQITFMLFKWLNVLHFNFTPIRTHCHLWDPDLKIAHSVWDSATHTVSVQYRDLEWVVTGWVLITTNEAGNISFATLKISSSFFKLEQLITMPDIH